MRARRGLRRSQGDSERQTRHEEGLRGSKALDEMWGGSTERAEERGDQPELPVRLRGPAGEGGVVSRVEKQLDKGRQGRRAVQWWREIWGLHRTEGVEMLGKIAEGNLEHKWLCFSHQGKDCNKWTQEKGSGVKARLS